MQVQEGLSLEQIRAFLEGSEEVGFQCRDREQVYGWVNQTLRQQRYQELKRSSRGLVRRYLMKLTGLSRAQIPRLITQHLAGDPVQLKPYRRRRFRERYTREDVMLLAFVDEAHETLSGPATRKILERAYHEFKESKYQRLATVGGAHVPVTEKPHIPSATCDISTHQADASGHRGTASARTGSPPWLSPSGHGASGGSGRSQGGVSHQHRG